MLCPCGIDWSGPKSEPNSFHRCIKCGSVYMVWANGKREWVQDPTIKAVKEHTEIIKKVTFSVESSIREDIAEQTKITEKIDRCVLAIRALDICNNSNIFKEISKVNKKLADAEKKKNKDSETAVSYRPSMVRMF